MKKLTLALTFLAASQLIACSHMGMGHGCCKDKGSCKMEKQTCPKCHDEKCDGKNCKEPADKGGCPDCKDKETKK